MLFRKGSQSRKKPMEGTEIELRPEGLEVNYANSEHFRKRKQQEVQ